MLDVRQLLEKDQYFAKVSSIIVECKKLVRFAENTQFCDRQEADLECGLQDDERIGPALNVVVTHEHGVYSLEVQVLSKLHLGQFSCWHLSWTRQICHTNAGDGQYGS